MRQHPRAGVGCNTCHTTGKLAVHNQPINEADPVASCATCHDLKKAGKMPFYVKGFSSLQDTANLPKAEALISAGVAIRDDLASYLQNIAGYEEAKLSFELSGPGQQKSAEGAPPFVVAKPQALVPAVAVASLGDTILDLPGAVTQATQLAIKLEARTAKARDLTQRLGLIDVRAPILEPDGTLVVIEFEIKDEYKPPLPLDGSLSQVQSLVAAQFPTAVVTKNETKSNERKYEWEVPGSPKTEIKFEWKQNDKTKIEFKKLAPTNEAAALGVLDGVRAAFASAVAQRERKEKTESKETAFKEVKLELKYSGASLPPATLTLAAQQVAQPLPAAVLKKNEASKIEWEVPAETPGTPKGEIKAETKNEEGKAETKFEFKKLPTGLHEAAMLVMATASRRRRGSSSDFGEEGDSHGGGRGIQAGCAGSRRVDCGVAGAVCGSAGPADGRQRPVCHGRHRAGGVLGVLHAEPVVPGASAEPGAGAGPVELPDAVRDDGDPQRQPYPADAGRDAGVALRSAVRRGSVGADRARRLRVLRVARAALAVLLAAPAPRRQQ